MTGMESLFGIIGVACGIYALYSWFHLKFKKDLTKSVLLPKSVNVKKCKDKEAYIKETLPMHLILGVAALVYGAVELLNYYVMPMKEVLMACMAVVVVILIVVTVKSKKINQKYFPGL